MASRGNIPWSPIKRYINRMQHLQSHLFYPLSFQRIPFYFIPSFNSPYNSFIHPITINSLYPSPLYMHNFIFVLRKRYLFKRKNIFSNFPNDRNQNKFHPGSRSTADYNRLFPPGVGEEEAARERRHLGMCTTFELSADRGRGGEEGNSVARESQTPTTVVRSFVGCKSERHPQIKRWFTITYWEFAGPGDGRW